MCALAKSIPAILAPRGSHSETIGLVLQSRPSRAGLEVRVQDLFGVRVGSLLPAAESLDNVDEPAKESKQEQEQEQDSSSPPDVLDPPLGTASLLLLLLSGLDLGGLAPDLQGGTYRNMLKVILFWFHFRQQASPHTSFRPQIMNHQRLLTKPG